MAVILQVTNANRAGHLQDISDNNQPMAKKMKPNKSIHSVIDYKIYFYEFRSAQGGDEFISK